MLEPALLTITFPQTTSQSETSSNRGKVMVNKAGSSINKEEKESNTGKKENRVPSFLSKILESMHAEQGDQVRKGIKLDQAKNSASASSIFNHEDDPEIAKILSKQEEPLSESKVLTRRAQLMNKRSQAMKEVFGNEEKYNEPYV